MKTKLVLLFLMTFFISFSQDYNYDKSVLLISVDNEENLLKYKPNSNGCTSVYIVKSISMLNQHEQGFQTKDYEKYIVKSVSSEEIIPFSEFYKFFELNKNANSFFGRNIPKRQLIFVKKQGDDFVFYPTVPYFWTI